MSGDRKEKGNEWQMVSFFSKAFLRKIKKNAASTNRPWNVTPVVSSRRESCVHRTGLCNRLGMGGGDAREPKYWGRYLEKILISSISIERSQQTF